MTKRPSESRSGSPAPPRSHDAERRPLSEELDEKLEHTPQVPQVPQCIHPYCRSRAEYVLPVGASSRNPDRPMPFCFGCLSDFMERTEKQRGSFERERVQRRVERILTADGGHQKAALDFAAGVFCTARERGENVREAGRLAREALSTWDPRITPTG